MQVLREVLTYVLTIYLVLLIGRMIIGWIQVFAREWRPTGIVLVLAEALTAEAGLVLAGVMAIAPLGMPPSDAFARLLDSAAAVRAVRPAATVISAGMSGDLEAAIAAGATHVRIGTALLGDRGARVR